MLLLQRSLPLRSSFKGEAITFTAAADQPERLTAATWKRNYDESTRFRN